MSPLPPEFVRRWLPDWRELADKALEAAQNPPPEPVRLMVLADKASEWPSPFGHKRDQYVGAVLIWAAKAFCKQDSVAMRQTLDGVLLEAALAFKARLERAASAIEATAPAPVIPLRRHRADIDDKPELDDEGQG